MSDGGETNLGVAPNVGGLLCYVPCCIGLVFSIVVAIVEKKSHFVRFHAFQSLLLHGAAIAVFVALWVVSLVLAMIAGPLALIVTVADAVIGLGLLAVVILMMVKAYGNESYKLPTIGDMADKWAANV